MPPKQPDPPAPIEEEALTEETGKILENIQAGALNPLHLTQGARRAVVLDLHLRGFGPARIARVLKFNRTTIWRDMRAIKEEGAQRTTDLDVREMAGEHIARAEHLAGMLQADKKWGDAWSVYRGLIHDLQSLGMVVKQPHVLVVKPPPEELEKLPDHELANEAQRIIDVSFEVDDEFQGRPADPDPGEDPEGEATG